MPLYRDCHHKSAIGRFFCDRQRQCRCTGPVAFNTVDHEILLRRLESSGIGGCIIHWFVISRPPTTVRLHFFFVLISNCHWMRCTWRVSPWPYSLSFVGLHCWTAVVDTGQWAEPSSLCWWHSDLRFLYTDGCRQLDRGTVSPNSWPSGRNKQCTSGLRLPAKTRFLKAIKSDQAHECNAHDSQWRSHKNV